MSTKQDRALTCRERNLGRVLVSCQAMDWPIVSAAGIRSAFAALTATTRMLVAAGFAATRKKNGNIRQIDQTCTLVAADTRCTQGGQRMHALQAHSFRG